MSIETRYIRRQKKKKALVDYCKQMGASVRALKKEFQRNGIKASVNNMYAMMIFDDRGIRVQGVEDVETCEVVCTEGAEKGSTEDVLPQEETPSDGGSIPPGSTISREEG